MMDPVDDLAANGPWPVQALCLECGSTHTSLALTRRNLERLGAKLAPHGTCPPCIAEDEATLRGLTADKRKAPEEPMPAMDDVYDTYRTDSRDADDPFGELF